MIFQGADRIEGEVVKKLFAQIFPDALNGVEFGRIGRQDHEPRVRREP